MKKITLSICSMALILFSCNNKADDAQSNADSTSNVKTTEVKNDSVVSAKPDSATMMKAWQDFKTPGDMHKWMQKLNGTWEADLSVWMDPAAPPEKSKGTITQTSILGGRYVSSKYSGTIFGQPTEGQILMAYDNAKILFVSTWIDNQGTGIVSMTGTYDSTTKTLNLKGTQTDPSTSKDAEIREELTIIDNDSYSMAMFGKGADGKETKIMEGIYKRKK